MGPPGRRPFPRAGCRAGAVVASGQWPDRTGLSSLATSHWPLATRKGTADPPASGAADGPTGGPPSAPPGRGRGGLKPPQRGGWGGTQHVPERSDRRLSSLPAQPNPPPNFMGGLGEHGGHDARRTRPTDGPRPRGSGFCRGHDDAWTGSAVPGRSAATRPGGGVTPAGAGTGRWTGRWATRKPDELPTGDVRPRQRAFADRRSSPMHWQGWR